MTSISLHPLRAHSGDNRTVRWRHALLYSAVLFATANVILLLAAITTPGYWWLQPLLIGG